MKTSRRKSAKENPSKKNSGIIDSWLDQYGDPTIDRLVKKNLAIARKIQEILDHKQMKAVDLAKLMNKQKSEISKWLTGQHTLSMRTITDIENALEADIVQIESKVNHQYLTTSVRYQPEFAMEDESNYEDSKYTNHYKSF